MKAPPQSDRPSSVSTTEQGGWQPTAEALKLDLNETLKAVLHLDGKMPRNISFALTTPQFQDGSKDVTRRLGWLHLKPGDILCAVKKSQGLKRGEKVERLGMIKVVDVRQEPLRRLTDDLDYGFAECKREGYPHPHPKSWPSEFVAFFCNSHKGCTPESAITRIEFERVPGPTGGGNG